jgi:SagB-type dehydrogenase family enzyme
MSNLIKEANFFSRFLGETQISKWEADRSVYDSGQRLKTYPRLTRHHLPKPVLPCEFSLAEALSGRMSALELNCRRFTLSEISILLSAIGLRPEPLISKEKRRTYPSAGARYPGETYLIALNCEALPSGLYHYAIQEHELEELWIQDLKEAVVEATDDRRTASASAILLFSLIYGRVVEKYGKRGLRYGLIEFGHMAQNIYLTAYALQIGCYEIGGFLDSAVNTWLDIDTDSEAAVLLVALGGKP